MITRTFTICVSRFKIVYLHCRNIVTMLLKKKIKKFETLAKIHNDAVDVACSALLAAAGEYRTSELEWYFRKALKPYGLNDNFTNIFGKVYDCYKKTTVQEVVTESNKKLTDMLAKRSELADWLETYKEKCIKNKKALKNAVEKRLIPPFVVMESLIDGSRRYCFCYEFKKTETDGIYYAYIVDDRHNAAYTELVDARVTCIKEMTDNDFEQHYIIGRLSLMGFSKETDIVEYDNYLRKYFNEQSGS